MPDPSNSPPDVITSPSSARPRFYESSSRQSLDESFCEMLKSDAVINRIGWLLFKYRVQDEMEVGDVTCEVYSRAIKSLDAGKEIANLNGWFRTTSHNIVREQFRAKARQKNIQDRLRQEHDPLFSDKTVSSRTDDQTPLNELLSRLEMLRPRDRKILMLQAQGMSMQQILKQLTQDGDLKVKNEDLKENQKTIAKITQWACRARRKLRKNI
jgi:RNA polymerase sigma factor (sigma-70 family)